MKDASPARRSYLSKSRIQSGRQCHKRLWLEVHRRDLIQFDAASQARFDEGNRFGELARDLLGGGEIIEAGPLEAERAQAATAALLTLPVSQVPRIFEAAFEYSGVRVRVDALLRGHRRDRMVEVKSGTSVKGEHLWDCAVQAWVMRGAGVDLGSIHLGHVNHAFVLKTAGDYADLLADVDVTHDVEPLIDEVPWIVRKLKTVVKGDQPAIATGKHCTAPHACPFFAHCLSQEPPRPEFPISLLPHGGRLVDDVLLDGITDLRDVPEDRLSNDKHLRIVQATQTGEAFFSPALAETLNGIAYPRHYLDFETISSAVPRWVGTRPYQPVPFQFSCHVEQSDGSIVHEEFLDISGDAPMAGFVSALLGACGDTGPILVWNRSFEARRIRDMAELFPARAEALLALVDRMIDLLPIYREHYYHPDMRGSWSIKAVLPTIAPELDYAGLKVGNGDEAQSAWREAVAPGTTWERKEQLRKAMLEYCERDTWAMVRLARFRHP